MFGVYSTRTSRTSGSQLNCEIVATDGIVDRNRTFWLKNTCRLSYRAVSNMGRPSYMLYGVTTSHIYDWYTDVLVGEEIVHKSMSYYPRSAAITTSGTFVIQEDAFCLRLQTASGMAIAKIEGARMSVDLTGELLYVADKTKKKYGPIGEALPCGWFMPELTTSSKSVRYCACSRTVASVCSNGMIKIADTRVRGYTTSERFMSRYAKSVACTFVSDALVAIYAATFDQTQWTYTPYVFDIRSANTYELCSVEKERSYPAPTLFACQ